MLPDGDLRIAPGVLRCTWCLCSMFAHLYCLHYGTLNVYLSCLVVYSTGLLVEYRVEVVVHVLRRSGGGGIRCRSMSALKAAGESSSTDLAGRLFHVLIVLVAKENLNEEVFDPRAWNLYSWLALVPPSARVRPIEVASTATCPWTT